MGTKPQNLTDAITTSQCNVQDVLVRSALDRGGEVYKHMYMLTWYILCV